MPPRRNKPTKPSKKRVPQRPSSPATVSRRGSSPATTRRGSSPASPLSISSDDENQSDNARPAKRTKIVKRLTMQEKALQFTSSFEEDLTNEEIREKQVQTWTSKYYKHFKMPPEIDARDPDVIRYQFYCKHFPQQFVTRARHDDSTSNLKRHVDTCSAVDEAAATGQLTIPMYAGGSTYSEPQLRLLLVQWCAVNARPMLIVEDEAFLKMMQMMHATVAIPSAATLSRDIQRVFDISKKHIQKVLAETPGRKHIILDGWSSPNVMSILGVDTTFVKDGKIINITLDCIRLTKAHTGIYLARKLAECLRDYNMEDTTLAIACDNASNNDKMLQELPTLLSSTATAGTEYQIRCFGHVLNLCVKAFLSLFDISEKAAKADSRSSVESNDDHRDSSDDEADDVDDDEVEEDDETARDNGDWDEIAELSASLDEVSALGSEEILVGRRTVKKLRKLGKKIRNSPILQAELADACKSEHIEVKKMIRAVDTRWNTLCDVIERALELRRALDRLLSQGKHRQGKNPLSSWRLSMEEWDLLEDILPMLKVFRQATKRLSTSGRPLVADVIPVIDLINQRLENLVNDFTKPSIVRASAAKGRAVLNKYYSKTDDSKMYRMCMMLHPKYKTHYFDKAQWELMWKDTAINILREEWNSRYKCMIDESENGAMTSDATDLDMGLFDELDQFGKTKADDVLDEYLKSPIDANVDPVSYWVSHLDLPGAKATPWGTLARMALDFLSAPATSTDVERLFSHGGSQVSKRRHSLGFSVLRSLMVLRSWFKEGLIPEDKVLEYFRELKSRRNKGRENDSMDIDD